MLINASHKSQTLADALTREIRESTERKRVEETLSKTNRVLAVISQINQMVIRTSEQNILFAEVCRIAVEFGKFRMAWIGLIDEQAHTVKPLHWYGIEEGYLTKIKKISTDDIAEGRGPTGRAIRDGKYFYSNDIANDPTMTPWREEALLRGYRSSIALPLILNGRVIGAFTIYAADPFFFNEKEINLLKEVTGDINYALKTMEIDKKHRQGEEKIKRINENLERRIAARTADLSAKTAELERINKVFVNRELRMRELKARIAELEGKDVKREV
jgi:GAF domain-containing protein